MKVSSRTAEVGVLAKDIVRTGEGANPATSVHDVSEEAGVDACACILLLDLAVTGVASTMKAPLIGPGQWIRESMHRWQGLPRSHLMRFFRHGAHPRERPIRAGRTIVPDQMQTSRPYGKDCACAWTWPWSRTWWIIYGA
jgi:hypothetical protein